MRESIAADSSLLDTPTGDSSGVELYALGFIGLLVIWWAASSLVDNKVFLPSPVQVGRALYALAQDGSLARETSASLLRVLVGFGLGAACALAAGIVIGLVKRVEEALEPFIELFRAIPPYAMIPFALLAFGVSDGGKIFVLAYASFFPVLLSTVSGISGVPLRLVEAARTLGAGAPFVITRVILPAAVPDITVGLRLGFGAAWISLIAAEMVASSSGLGSLIADARETLDTAVVVAGMLTIGVVGYASNRLFLVLEKWGNAQ